MANKVDLKARRIVSADEGLALANNKELLYCECSVVSRKLSINNSIL